jgi:hypothetical protein
MASTSVALAGGGAATPCQDNGWTTLMRTDGSRFANQGHCAAYAARGGTLVAVSASQLLCESFEGTFTRGTYPVLWVCEWPVTDSGVEIDALLEACAVDTSQRVSFSATVVDGVGTATCAVALF